MDTTLAGDENKRLTPENIPQCNHIDDSVTPLSSHPHQDQSNAVLGGPSAQRVSNSFQAPNVYLTYPTGNIMVGANPYLYPGGFPYQTSLIFPNLTQPYTQVVPMGAQPIIYPTVYQPIAWNVTIPQPVLPVNQTVQEPNENTFKRSAERLDESTVKRPKTE